MSVSKQDLNTAVREFKREVLEQKRSFVRVTHF